MAAIRTIAVGRYQANAYVVWDKSNRAVVIDPGDEADCLLSEIRELGVHVEAIVLTHAHFDHIMATKALQEATGASLLIHKADALVLNDPVYTMVELTHTLTPDRLLQEGDTITIGEETLTVLHTPGHTAGSICLLCDMFLFSGDTLFNGSIGRTDFIGGDIAAMRASLVRLSELPDAVCVFPGHGDETTIGREKHTNPFMMGL